MSLGLPFTAAAVRGVRQWLMTVLHLECESSSVTHKRRWGRYPVCQAVVLGIAGCYTYESRLPLPACYEEPAIALRTASDQQTSSY